MNIVANIGIFIWACGALYGAYLLFSRPNHHMTMAEWDIYKAKNDIKMKIMELLLWLGALLCVISSFIK